jgi:hypothetical protein
MAEVKIAVGDEVRVHFHAPGAMRSYCEGVVHRMDVAMPEGALRSGAMAHVPSLREPQPEALRHELRERFTAAATARGST